MTTENPVRDMVVTTRESHLRAVARHHDLPVEVDGREVVVHRLLISDAGDYLGRLVYRAEIRQDGAA